MEEFKPGKKWQTGPEFMDSEEIRKAFGKQRFYYVFSSPPMPPGAEAPDPRGRTAIVLADSAPGSGEVHRA